MKLLITICILFISSIVYADNPEPTETGNYYMDISLPPNPDGSGNGIGLHLGHYYGSSREEAVDMFIQMYVAGFKKHYGITTSCRFVKFGWNGLLYSDVYLEGDHCTGAVIQHDTIWTCPKGYIVRTGHGGVSCWEEYVAILPDETPDTQCSVGNPIETSSGVKTQKEIDVHPVGEGQIKFERSYSNANRNKPQFWHYSYAKELRVLNPRRGEGIRSNSWLTYPSKSDACVDGWRAIQEDFRANWSHSTVARYVNNNCQIMQGDTVVKNLAIVLNEVSETNPPAAVLLLRDNGSSYSFVSDNSTHFHSVDGEHGELQRVNDGNVAWRYHPKSGEVEDYSVEGKLIAITARNGMIQQLFYDETTGLLNRVRDSTGRELKLAYIGNQLANITVDGNKTTSYSYNSLGVLTSVIRPDSTQRSYHYEDSRFPKFLTGITNERGIRYATWKYDDIGRGVSSEHAGGADRTLLGFNNDGSTTVTNPLGKKTTYHFADIAGARRVTTVEGHATPSCDGANQNYTYTAEGLIRSKTDWKGNTTTYTYNDKGQEISRTEASGTGEARSVTTEWHPTLPVRTRVAGEGREITYTYDNRGQLLNTTVNPL